MQMVEPVALCKHGHPLTEDNIYVNPKRGVTECATCRKENAKRWRERNPNYMPEYRNRQANPPQPWRFCPHCGKPLT
jgi:hypothetical protein